MSTESVVELDRNYRRSLVIVRLMGGLGNQLYQYASGRAVALKQNARLRLDASWYRGRDDRSYVLSHFEIREDLLKPAETRLLQYWLGRRHRRAKSVVSAVMPPLRMSHIVDPVDRVTSEAFETRGNIYLDGYWQSPAYFHNAEELLRREFCFRTAPSASTSSLLDRLRNCESVAVHVRRGDYVTNATTNEFHGICGADYYERAAKIIGERVASPRFYVFSDDPAAARQELRLPGPTEFVVENVGRRDWDDLRMMAGCRHHIIANSSFSWWGAWLAKHDEQVVVAPKMWFQPEVMVKHRLEDRIPSEWVTT